MTTKKIEKLTKEQEKALEKFAEDFIARQLKPGPADRPFLEKAYRRWYEISGLKTDIPIYWADSPLAAARMVPLVAKQLANPGKEVKLTKADKPDFAPAWNDGLWCWWAAWGAAFRDVLGIEIDPRFAETYEAVARGSFWLPYSGFIVASERHSTEVKRDDQGRLHSETGPTIAWPDGFGVYAWHGTRVPKDWILNRATLDPKVALTYPNVEQRRAAAEIIGWSKVLASVNAKTIQKDRDPEIGELIEADLPDAPGSRFLRVRCGTGREFVLPVPADMTSAKQANAWTYNLQPDELELEVRT